MTGRDIIKKIMERKGVSLAELGRRTNGSTQAIWGRLNAKTCTDLTMTMLTQMADAMGYKVAVIPKNWVVTDGGYVYDGVAEDNREK